MYVCKRTLVFTLLYYFYPGVGVVKWLRSAPRRCVRGPHVEAALLLPWRLLRCASPSGGLLTVRVVCASRSSGRLEPFKGLVHLSRPSGPSFALTCELWGDSPSHFSGVGHVFPLSFLLCLAGGFMVLPVSAKNQRLGQFSPSSSVFSWVDVPPISRRLPGPAACLLQGVRWAPRLPAPPPAPLVRALCPPQGFLISVETATSACGWFRGALLSASDPGRPPALLLVNCVLGREHP